jgi:hypothetical protein
MDMACRLSISKLHLIGDMLESQFTTSQMAEEAECTYLRLSILSIFGQFGIVYDRNTRIGPKKGCTPLTTTAPCDHLSEKPGLYLDEMAVFMWDELKTMITTSSIRRALIAVG